jgi:hypothetical protein
MTLDPVTREQLIEARKRIKAQLMDDERAARDTIGRGGPPDFRGVYAELKDELHQIDEVLGIDAAEDGDEPGDEDRETEDELAAAPADYQPAPPVATGANAPSSRVVVDDAASWNFSRIVLIALVLTVGIALAVALAK